MHLDFKRLVKTCWEEDDTHDWVVYKFMSKLKSLKSNLKKWNKEVFGDIRTKKKKKELMKEIECIDKVELEGVATEDLIRKRKAFRNELEEVVLKEMRSLREKTKVKWAKEGDVNSKLFFRVVNGRRRRNFIKELELEYARVIFDQKGIEEEITSFRKRLFTVQNELRSCPKGHEWDPIFDVDMRWLERPFKEEEVRKAVFDLGQEKSPTPHALTTFLWLSSRIVGML